MSLLHILARCGMARLLLVYCKVSQLYQDAGIPKVKKSQNPQEGSIMPFLSQNLFRSVILGQKRF